MKQGCLEIKYDIASVSAEERIKFEKELKGVAGRSGFDLLEAGQSLVEGERDLLFVRNIKRTQREVNGKEAKVNPPTEKKAKVEPAKKA